MEALSTAMATAVVVELLGMAWLTRRMSESNKVLNEKQQKFQKAIDAIKDHKKTVLTKFCTRDGDDIDVKLWKVLEELQ